jgi:succinyl-diaminopimelate desuccinylase
VDVVPAGLESAWRHGAFNTTIKEGVMYGRGVVDMKCAIAAFLDTAMQVSQHQGFADSISLLITGDEEGPAKYGTKEVLKTLEAQGEKIDYCLLGEPTSEEVFGDTILIGRRGSVSYYLEVEGRQGHVAYPHMAFNPVNALVAILAEVKALHLDAGNEHFEPSNLEITSVDVGNSVTNLIPNSARAIFNVRYNSLQTAEGMASVFEQICSKYASNYTLNSTVFAKPFIVEPRKLVSALRESIAMRLPALAGRVSLSAAGGTSDARFIQHYVSEVAEFGLLTKTAHHVDENANVSDIIALRDIYLDVINRLSIN